MSPREIALHEIVLDPELQPRSEISMQTVDEYMIAMRGGVKFPPVVVFETDAGTLLADGFHRVRAATIADLETIEAEVVAGSREDALLFTLRCDHPNARHGLRRTNEDKRRAVAKMLELRGSWSDRQIAEWVGVSDKTVGKHRPSTAEDPQLPEKRLGKDGKERRLPEPSRDREPRADEPEIATETEATHKEYVHDDESAEPWARDAAITEMEDQFYRWMKAWRWSPSILIACIEAGLNKTRAHFERGKF